MLEVSGRVRMVIDGAQHSGREEYEKLGTEDESWSICLSR